MDSDTNYIEPSRKYGNASNIRLNKNGFAEGAISQKKCWPIKLEGLSWMFHYSPGLVYARKLTKRSLRRRDRRQEATKSIFQRMAAHTVIPDHLPYSSQSRMISCIQDMSLILCCNIYGLLESNDDLERLEPDLGKEDVPDNFRVRHALYWTRSGFWCWTNSPSKVLQLLSSTSKMEVSAQCVSFGLWHHGICLQQVSVVH